MTNAGPARREYPVLNDLTPVERRRLAASYELADGGCLVWTATTTHGYPAVFISGRYHQAARLMFTIANGSDPGRPLRRTCGTDRCVNPAHQALVPAAAAPAGQADPPRHSATEVVLPTQVTAYERRFFVARVDRRAGATACWPWTGSKRDTGYGVTRLGPKVIGAHRVAYLLAVGPIPDGLWVLHHCDNPPCCNPAHLFAGTHTDNMADMARKGRAAEQGVLTPEQVSEVIRTGGPAGPLAERLGVSANAVHRIRRGETYRRHPLAASLTRRSVA